MLDDNGDLVASTTEILRDRLFLIAFKKSHKPKNTTHLHYFCIDDDFVYENFYNDFGPLNICMLYRYCQKLSTKLTAKCHAGKKIIHYTSMNSAKRLNAAYLIGSYAIIYLHKTPDEVYRRLTLGETPAYTRFCDASYGPSNFKISLIDCLNAISKASRAGFFNFNDFDAEEYEFYERVENGDFNWIVPQKFIAFCGPHQLSKTLPNGYPCHSPQTYFEYFRMNNVTTVIRLNAKVYHASSFVNAGFDHRDLFFVDGSTPSDQILKKFLSICETTKGAIAVHCKAGLGRTGSLIGAYIMKHYNFSALEAIAWLRLCRPGSVIGHQQQWMEDKQSWLWSEGERLRDRCNVETPVHVYGIYSVALKRQMAEDDLVNDNPELLPPMVKGISQRVDTMHLNDAEEALEAIITTSPPASQSRLERQNSRGSGGSNRKTRARSLAIGGQRKESSVRFPNANSSGGGGGLSSLSNSGGSDYEDVVDGAEVNQVANNTRRRKSPNLSASNYCVDFDSSVGNGNVSILTPSLRKCNAMEQQQQQQLLQQQQQQHGNSSITAMGRLTTEPLYSEKKLKKPSAVVESANSTAACNLNALAAPASSSSITTTHNKHTIASTVKMTQAAIERQNAQTQGDKLNQIKAMRRQHHNSRAGLPTSSALASAAAADLENPMRHTRARSQPFRNNNNNNNIVNMLTTASATTVSPSLKHLIATSNSSNNPLECMQQHINNNNHNNNNAIHSSDQLNNNVTTITTTANNNNNNNNNNNFTSAMTTRARSLAIYSKRMGLMQLRKGDAQQQQQQQQQQKGANDHHDVTTPTLSSLNKQTKQTYNSSVLSGATATTNSATASASSIANTTTATTTTASYNDSKIPVVRATAALLDLGGTVCRVASVMSHDASATIPPTRSRAPSHHYTLRGRSRIRYHNRALLATATSTSPLACGGAGGSTPPPSAASGRSSCRDLSTLAQAAAAVAVTTATATTSNGVSTRSSTSAAPLDLNSNPLPGDANRAMVATEKQPHHYNHQQQQQVTATNELNNNNFASSSSSSAVAQPPVTSSAFEVSANAVTSASSAATTNGLQTQSYRVLHTTTTSATGIPIHQQQHNNYTGGGGGTSASTKRNKRSLSNARIEKEKCDEYNTKLLRKTRTATTTTTSASASSHANSNGNVLSGGGGSFKGRRGQIPTATATTTTTTSTAANGNATGASASSSTSAGALLVLDATTTSTNATTTTKEQQACEAQQQRQQQQQHQQQRLLLKLRKKVSY